MFIDAASEVVKTHEVLKTHLQLNAELAIALERLTK